VVIGLVAGKALGIFAGTYLAARFTRAQLNPEPAWADVFGLAALAALTAGAAQACRSLLARW
jgi:Na+:H+ antiporter, NhaA family